MEYLLDILILYRDYAFEILINFLNPGSRIFFVYIIGSIFIAFFVYLFGTRRKSGDSTPINKNEGFLSFLFPAHVWSHPSAWLDVRYFFFHKLIAHFFFLGLMAGCMAWGYALVTGGENIAEAAKVGDELSDSPITDLLIAIGYMFVFFVVGDFLAYLTHYLQHKIPILWEFHKVHHSAEVMHPLSNFREHPVDNFAYDVVTGVGYGLFLGAASTFFEYVPTMPSVFGVPILMFLFNLLGYNLRHSHIWLRWPGVWSKVFPSPAHHHVHHSCHPDHLDKNFAFLFPFWDVVFGTYEMPNDNKDIKFGVLGMESMEMDTCTKLYTVPFQKVGKRLRGKTEDTEENLTTAEYLERMKQP